MIEKILKKIRYTFFTKKTQLWIEKGDNVRIKSSAIFITFDSGKITLSGDNYIGRNVEIGTHEHVEIGNGTTIQDRCIILGNIEIGKFCTFAPNVYMSSGRHHYNFKPEFYIRDQDIMASTNKNISEKVVIEDDVWLGINSVIMPGIKIGRGSVIGANSVVTKDVPPFSIMAGVPAQLIKKRLDFIPKTSLKFDNNNDLPNFYKGFFLDIKNIELDRKLGGLGTSGIFTLYLDDTSKKIRIKCKKISLDPITISYNNQHSVITQNEFVELLFDAKRVNYHIFGIEKSVRKDNKCLLIQSVELF